MAAVRMLPQRSVHPKLQDPKQVIPAFRGLGSDNEAMMEEIREFYSQINDLSQGTFIDSNDQEVQKIAGQTRFDQVFVGGWFSIFLSLSLSLSLSL